MAPPQNRSNRPAAKSTSSSSGTSTSSSSPPDVVEQVLSFFKDYVNPAFVQKALTNPEYTWVVALFLLACELVINGFIVLWRPYTEIDWKAYMQEVEGFMNVTLDYQYLKGDTGPLVYPAGFVYVFSLFYLVTDQGRDVRLAQWIFVLLYLLLAHQVFKLYSKSRKVPPYALLFLTFTSYRIHSIFVLRLFNDPVAILLCYVSLNLFLEGRWTFGSLVYSLAVSVKMNVLLYAPALLVVYLTQLSIFDATVQLAVCGMVQVVLALPFLSVNPYSYISRSFDLGRVFLYEWTVNWKFLPEEVFLSRIFHLGLLAAHILALVVFMPTWTSYLGTYRKFEDTSKSKDGKYPMQIRSQLMLFPLFVSNFIGVVFSRSLHYQFYVWYYHTIPYLLWSTRLPTRVKLIIFGVIELCWNIFPATPWSSLSLTLCHLTILGSIWYYTRPRKDWSQLQFTDIKNTVN